MSRASVFLKHTYRRLVPLWIRRSPVAARLKDALHRRLGHQSVYDLDYFRHVIEAPAAQAAPTIAASIWRDFVPESVIDIGCGTGALLGEFRCLGCQVLGLEYADAAIEHCRQIGVPVQKFDIEKDTFDATRLFGVAISLEVAEHLPERSAAGFVRLLTRLADRIVFTAAQPGQGGTDHCNEQPPAYWIQRFQQQGFMLDAETTNRWRREWSAARVVAWYHDNLMVFRRADR